MSEKGGQETIERIDEFIAGQAPLAFLNDFDAALQGREERLPDRASESVAELAWLLYDLARNHLYMLRVGNLKLVQIAKGIRWAIEAGNPTVQISLVRSLLEHTAALSFQFEKLSGIQDDLSRQADVEKLKSALARHQTVLNRIYFNQVALRAEREEKHFHVNDFRKSLRKDYPDEERAYDELCEFVHPNCGSNYLVSSGVLGSGILDRPHSDYAAEIEAAGACARKCLELADRYEKAASVLLIKLDSRIEIAGTPGARTTTIFSEKGLSHTGDGSSKENAICFSKSRTHIEAVEMIGRFVASQGMDFRGRSIAGLEKGFLFETVHTDRGLLWFKTKTDW